MTFFNRNYCSSVPQKLRTILQDLENTVSACLLSSPSAYLSKQFEIIKNTHGPGNYEDVFSALLDEVEALPSLSSVIPESDITYWHIRINAIREGRNSVPEYYNPLYLIDHMDGSDFERWCAELLSKSGFSSVVISGKSGDQGVDIFAEKDGIKYAVQCKCYSSNLGNSPVQEVFAGMNMFDCQVGVVMTNQYFTEGAQALARMIGVLLWDRDTLDRMIKSTSGS